MSWMSEGYRRGHVIRMARLQKAQRWLGWGLGVHHSSEVSLMARLLCSALNSNYLGFWLGLGCVKETMSM